MSRMSRVIYGNGLTAASILLCRRDGNGILQYSSAVSAPYLDESLLINVNVRRCLQKCFISIVLLSNSVAEVNVNANDAFSWHFYKILGYQRNSIGNGHIGQRRVTTTTTKISQWLINSSDYNEQYEINGR